MTVRGSLKTMSVADLLEWADRRELRGELTLDHASTTRRIQVNAGMATGASSTDPTEYLGQLLINHGHLTEVTLSEAYAQQTSNGISLGKILLVSNLVTEQALREVLELKIKESVFAALSWQDGLFLFTPNDDAPRTIEVEVALPLRDLLVDGAERGAKWRELRGIIPGDDTRFFLPDRTWLDKAKPGSASALILGDVLRGLSVREIILERHSVPFPVYQRLAELVTRHIIRIDRRGDRRPADQSGEAQSPAALVAAARGRAKGDRAGALDLARRALTAAPDDAEIKKAYHELERKLFAELSRTLLTKFRVPRVLKGPNELADLELTAEERYLLGRIDGRWDLLSLMRVSPLREVEALITFQRLADRGVISLG